VVRSWLQFRLLALFCFLFGCYFAKISCGLVPTNGRVSSSMSLHLLANLLIVMSGTRFSVFNKLNDSFLSLFLRAMWATDIHVPSFILCSVSLFQYDVYGNLFGLLAAHPVTPFVSMHHLDVVEPIFPNMTRVRALKKITEPMKLDSAGLLQQSICYDKHKSWTISVSWGYAVQIFRGIFSPREMEMPSRTFLNWYKRADYTAYAFNTRPVSRNPCQKPFVFYMSSTKFDQQLNTTVSEYTIHRVSHPSCRWKMTNPAEINTIVVYKKPDPHLWERVSKISSLLAYDLYVINVMYLIVFVCVLCTVT